MVDLKNNQIGVFSDIHIGLGQDGSLWHNCVIDFAYWVKELYESKNIKDIIIPGDVFHNRNEISVNTLNIAKIFFEILSNFNIYILAGNHDCYYKDRSDINSISLLSYWDNIQIADKEILLLKYKNKKISLIPWATPLDKIPKSDLCFGHFEINSFHMNTHKICEHGIASENILDKSPIIISGHFHKKSSRKYSNGIIHYLGSPYQQNFGDTEDERGVYILNLEDNDLKFFPNTISPKHIKINLSQLISGLKTSNYLKNSVPNNLISLIIDVNIPSEKISLIASKIQTLNPKSFRIDYRLDNDITVTDNQINYSSIDIPKSIEDFVESLDVQYKNEVVNYLNQLYTNINK
jgi:DNA repair exonuclease SbcCD nuclease subunit